MKLSDVIKVWDIIHRFDIGDLGFCDFEKAIDDIVGVTNDITCSGTPPPGGDDE